MSSPNHTPSLETISQNMFPYATAFPNYMCLPVQRAMVHTVMLIQGVELFFSNIEGTTKEAIKEQQQLCLLVWHTFANDS